MSTKRALSFFPTLSPEEAELLIKTAGKHHEFHYGLIFSIIVLSGCSLKHALDIRVRDLDVENSRLAGIPVPKELTEYLKDKIRENRLRAKDRLFNVSARRVHYVFKSAAKKAGLDPIYSPFSLRHVHGEYFKWGVYRIGFRSRKNRRQT